MIVGRAKVLEVVRAGLQQAQTGRASALVVRGEPGIGKSTVLEAAVDVAAGAMRVLRITGVEAESHLPFGGLFGLLRPVLSFIDELPDIQADALRGALGLAPPGTVDVFVVAMATLSLLAAVSTAGPPLLVVIDDLQWLDPNSAMAIVFTARRLVDDPVAILLGFREGAAADDQIRDLPTLRLTGFDRADAEALLAAKGTPVAGAVAEVLVGRTNGNPLALVESGAALDDQQRAGTRPLGDDPLVGAGTQRAFGHAVDALTPSASQALLVLAVEPSDEREVIVSAIALLGLDPDALEEAEAAGLVDQDTRSIRFRHPLVREAVRRASTPGQRRQAHAALAGVLISPGNESRRAAHLGAAALDPDADVADALDAAAQQAGARGDLVAASWGFSRAADLTPDRELRATRLYAAGAAATSSGLPHAAALLAAAEVGTGDPALRDQILIMQAFRAVSSSDNAFMLELADRYEQEHPGTETAILLHSFATPSAWQRLDGHALRRHADLVMSGVDGPSERDDLHGIAGVCVVLGTMAAGRTDVELIRRLGEEMVAQPDHDMAPPVLYSLTNAQLFDLNRRVTDVSLPAARAASALPAVAYIQASATLLAFWTGRLAEGDGPGRESVELARLTGMRLAESQAHISLALCAADRGDEVRCRASAGEAASFQQRCDSWIAPIYAELALGRLELGLARPDDAADRLLATQLQLDQAGFHGCALFPVLPDLVEALIRGGREDEARRWADELARRVADDSIPGLRHALARAQAALAQPDDLDEAFGAALVDRAPDGNPIELGRTELLYGSSLRRRGRRSDARVHLTAAHRRFTAAGALGWAEQARRELVAVGAAPRPSAPSPVGALTPQEQQIAALAATGASTREIASTLFLSPKTIETHLTRIYRKVGVRSKSELAHRMSSADNRPSPGPPA